MLKQNEIRTRIPEINKSLITVLGEPEMLHRSSPLFWCDNALEVLLATILTQATSDKNALQAWRNLKQLCQEPEQILELEEKALTTAIQPAGIMKRRSETIKGVLLAVYGEFGEYSLQKLSGKPDFAWEILNRIPGVGPKTAACTMLFGLGLPCFPVDTHIHRIVWRLGWVDEKSKPEDAQEVLGEVIPFEYQASMHILLLNLGRKFCRPREPKCGECPIGEYCPNNL